MTDARHDELRESAAHAKTVKATPDVVASGEVVRQVEASMGALRVGHWSAARLPIVERDSYEIDGEIAHGGIGRILRGRSVPLDRPVAIKELLDPDADDAERFVCEALLTARLQLGRHAAWPPARKQGERRFRRPTCSHSIAVTMTTRILVVEDNADLRGLYREILDMAGYACHFAATVEEALAALVTIQPSVVLLHLGIAGDLVARRSALGASGREGARIIVVSGASDLPARVMYLGAVTYVRKPFTPEQLIATIDAVLDSPRSGGA